MASDSSVSQAYVIELHGLRPPTLWKGHGTDTQTDTVGTDTQTDTVKRVHPTHPQVTWINSSFPFLPMSSPFF